MAQTHVPVDLNQLIAQFPKYMDPNRIRTDVLNVWRHRQSLVPKRGKLTLDSGLVCELLMLEGTFSIVYRGVEYFTPVEIYITENYPTSPPMCYIRPTTGMSLKVGHRHVDQSGLVYLPYLHEWSARTHNLVELIANMSSVFGAEPPLFATPARRPSPTPPRPHPGSGDRDSSTGNRGNHGQHGQSPFLVQDQFKTRRELPPTPTPEEVRNKKEKLLTTKLQGELRAMYESLRADMDAAFETQAQLEDDRHEVEEDVEELSRRNKELARLIQVSKERERELDTYLQDKKKEGEPSVDDLIEPKDALSDQMLRLVAENAALEDALYYLDVGLTDSVITVDVFLKEIRRLARKQFVARATAKKVERIQEEVNAQRANFHAQQQQQQQAGSRASGGYYPHLPPQQATGGRNYMGGPPPVYTPPTGVNYTGVGGTAAGAWRGAGGATAVGGGANHGYPSYGGAQTPYTQRR
ncbi:unnamed protein product [Scytosiphon promiscuus]